MVLPAPFSPASTCTSPPQASKSTSARTGTAPKRLPMPRMRRSGVDASAPTTERSRRADDARRAAPRSLHRASVREEVVVHAVEHARTWRRDTARPRRARARSSRRRRSSRPSRRPPWHGRRRRRRRAPRSRAAPPRARAAARRGSRVASACSRTKTGFLVPPPQANRSAMRPPPLCCAAAFIASTMWRVPYAIACTVAR